MFVRLTVILVFLICAAAASAQSNGADASRRSSGDRGDDKPAPSEGMLEMQSRWRVRAAEKEYNEIIERSDDVLKTADSLKTSFAQNNQLAGADIGKLAALEKQIKKIRKALGGDDDEEISAEAAPASLADALAKMREVSDSLNEELKNLTRHQVSASSIESANQLLDLVVYVRTHLK